MKVMHFMLTNYHVLCKKYNSIPCELMYRLILQELACVNLYTQSHTADIELTEGGSAAGRRMALLRDFQ